jgi:hypothetical protein
VSDARWLARRCPSNGSDQKRFRRAASASPKQQVQRYRLACPELKRFSLSAHLLLECRIPHATLFQGFHRHCDIFARRTSAHDVPALLIRSSSRHEPALIEIIAKAPRQHDDDVVFQKLATSVADGAGYRGHPIGIGPPLDSLILT